MSNNPIEPFISANSIYLLRPWTHEDINDLVEAANNKNIADFMTDQFPHPYTQLKAKSFIEFTESHAPVQIFAIECDNKAVGSIGIHPQSDIMKMNAELGYWLSESYWGKGIITSVVRDMLAYVFASFPVHRVYARPFGTNLASQRVLEKAGFKLEGKFEKTILKNGIMLDELIYAVRREDSKKAGAAKI